MLNWSGKERSAWRIVQRAKIVELLNCWIVEMTAPKTPPLRLRGDLPFQKKGRIFCSFTVYYSLFPRHALRVTLFPVCDQPSLKQKTPFKGSGVRDQGLVLWSQFNKRCPLDAKCLIIKAFFKINYFLSFNFFALLLIFLATSL
jgi:hypothetical protein